MITQILVIKTCSSFYPQANNSVEVLLSEEIFVRVEWGWGVIKNKHGGRQALDQLFIEACHKFNESV